MGRPRMNGQYAVPKEILELKPSEISCTVKVIRVPTKTTGYKYPDGKYSIEQILQALKDIRVIEVDNGNGYQPDYNNSELISDLLACCELTELTHEVVMKDTMKKNFEKNFNSP